MPNELQLEVPEFTDLTRWRWVLKSENEALLADHEVRLDRNDAWFEAFTGLRAYIDWHAAPDRRMAAERRIVTALGDWIGAEVFGLAVGRALLKHRPAIVQVVLREGAEPLAYLPLEAARFQGRSLADHDVTLVIQPPSADDVPSAARTSDRLRVLGLFSLPEGGTALNLRRERRSLVTLIGQIAATGRAADVKAVQYGVTRDRLRGILEDGEGWDVIHISGHGVPGELVIETVEGRPDRISAADVADLLELARDHVKLVTVSACWSAALATAEPRRLLGLPAQQDQKHSSPERITASLPYRLPAPGDIATTLASRLGCAVLAMRFPVGDEFAIEFATKLYELLADEGQLLPSAVRMTLKHLADRPVEKWFPALSMAAPAIFGATATGLTLKAPESTGPVSETAEQPKMDGFPPQPDRFVGRTGVMTRASAALAPDSGIPGVILHGIPGGGKTACALELAYTHQDSFDRLIWFKAPESFDTTGALAGFAGTLERNLPGLEMIDKFVTEEALSACLPNLTELMGRNRLLLVIDNAESLLTDSGEWRDEPWGQVVAPSWDTAASAA